MALRSLLLALVVAATAAFIVGTAIERNPGETGHHEAVATVKPAVAEKAATGEGRAQAGGESAATHAKEGGVTPATTTTEKPHPELRPLGINVESWPFVAIAAVASLALALGALHLTAAVVAAAMATRALRY